MKRKGIAVPGAKLLKWHFVFFVVFTAVHLMSILATFEYPGNRDIPFAMFKTFIVERMHYIILWSGILLVHFGVQELRQWWLLRTYDQQRNLFTRSDRGYGERLTDVFLVEEVNILPQEQGTRKS